MPTAILAWAPPRDGPSRNILTHAQRLVKIAPMPSLKKPRPPLAAELRRRRRELDLTQSQLAECAGVTFSYIAHVELGTREASPELLVKLCECLGMTTRQLLQRSNSKEEA